MNIVNLTGCRIFMSDERGDVVQIIEPGNEKASVEGASQTFSVDNVRVDYLTAEQVVGLPAPQKDTIYIVNGDVARATERDDVVTPELSANSAHLVADTYIGVQRLLNVKRLERVDGES